MSDNAAPTGQQQPHTAWLEELRAKFTAGVAHTFLLHGAIDDYPTRRRVRLDGFLADAFKSRPVVLFHSLERGLHFPDPSHAQRFWHYAGHDQPPAGKMPNLAEDLTAIEAALTAPDARSKIVVVFEQPELVWPDNEAGRMSPIDRFALGRLRRWASHPDFTAAGQILVLPVSAPGELHAALRSASSMIEQVEIPYPTADERREFIESWLADHPDVQLGDDIDASRFASLTGGLTRLMVEDICLRAALDGHPIEPPLIKDRKDQLVRAEFGDLIEILEPRHGFAHVGGLVEVKRYLARSVIAPLRGQKPMSRMPSGVLLAGPPGTGKTFLIVALGSECATSVVKLNVGRLLGSYVGTSERNLERALACIRSLAPCLVLVDEIDQQFQRGSGGGGGGEAVERRIFGRILEEMSGASGDQRGKVIWFAATNRPDNVDAALRRRFDKLVPILPPGDEERAQIIHQKLGAPGQESPRWAQLAEHWAQIVSGTDGFTGAELDGLIIKATELADDAGADEPAGEHVVEALRLLRRPRGSDRDMMTKVAQ